MAYFARFEKLQKYIGDEPVDEFKEGTFVEVDESDTLDECENNTETTSEE